MIKSLKPKHCLTYKYSPPRVNTHNELSFCNNCSFYFSHMSLWELSTYWFSSFLSIQHNVSCHISQIRWRMLVDSNFHVMPQIFNSIHVWGLTRPFQNTHLPFFKPFLCSFCPALWLFVLLEQIFYPEQRCLADWSRFFSSCLCLASSMLPVMTPVPPERAWCHHHHPWSQEGYYLGVGTYLVCAKHYALTLDQMVLYSILYNFIPIRPQNLFPKAPRFSHMAFLRSGFLLVTLPWSPNLWRADDDVEFCTGSHFSQWAL